MRVVRSAAWMRDWGGGCIVIVIRVPQEATGGTEVGCISKGRQPCFLRGRAWPY